ncbi:MAG: hypothetical protein ACLSV7_10735, partial [Oscillospiraceae bacterium]
SNPRPADYKSAALPAELYRRLEQNTLIIAMGTLIVKYYFHEFSSGSGGNARNCAWTVVLLTAHSPAFPSTDGWGAAE